MEDDNKFWLAIWKVIGIAFCVLVISVSGCVSNTHYQVTQALLKGVDPLYVACAHDMSTSDHSPNCAILASKR